MFLLWRIFPKHIEKKLYFTQKWNRNVRKACTLIKFIRNTKKNTQQTFQSFFLLLVRVCISLHGYLLLSIIGKLFNNDAKGGWLY